jgi:dTDP-4-amino-4,6-dideoxygalactose transaminase
MDLFARYDLAGKVTVPGDEPRGRHVWNQFVIRVAEGRRDALRAHLTKAGIGSEIYYPVPLHMQQCFAHLGWQKGDLPQTELAAEETLALPIFPELTLDEQHTVVARIAEFLAASPLQPPTRPQPAANTTPLDTPHVLRRTGAVGRADEVRW